MVDAVGWQQRSRKDARLLLANALVTIAAIISDGSVVGMARASGDGERYVHLSDVAVHPDYQGNGIGSALLRRLLAALDDRSGGEAVVTLNAEGERTAFYARFGFAVSETPNFLVRPASRPLMEAKAAPASLVG